MILHTGLHCLSLLSCTCIIYFCSYSVVYNIIFEGQLLYWHLVAIYVVVAYSSVYLKKKSLLDHTCSFKLHRDL